MPNSDHIFILPVLRNKDGDLSKKWYVEFKVWNNANNKWDRFRYSENINTYKTKKDRTKYGKNLVASLTKMLQDGWHPDSEEEIDPSGSTPPPKNTAAAWMLREFLSERKDKVKKKTHQSYSLYTTGFIAWLSDHRLAHKSIQEIESAHIRQYLNEMLTQRSWSNRTYNNALLTLRIAFGKLIELYPKIISDNPALKVSTEVAKESGNVPFTDREFKQITEYLKEHRPYLYKFSLGIYYQAIRPHQELRNLKCKDIDFDGDRVVISSGTAKNSKRELIPLDPIFKKLLIEMEVDSADPEWYVFTYSGKPGPERVAESTVQEHFKVARAKCSISGDRSLYAFKHTRGIHLYKDTKDPYFIMRLFRHSDINTTMKYLRGLGADLDEKNFTHSREF